MSELLQFRRELADRLALPMFVLSLVFMALLASLIVIWIDIPRVAELAALDEIESQLPDAEEGVANDDPEMRALTQATTPYATTGWVVLGVLCTVWLLFWVELAVKTLLRLRAGEVFSLRLIARGLLACLLPPLRLAAPSPAWDGRIWLPILHWQHPGRSLSQTLARVAGKPMLIIALLILPVLLIEYGLSSVVEEHDWLRMVMHISTGFIWFAFAVEFIIMVSATDKKLAYIKKNWIDLAIILLPLISFLRSIRALRLARLAKVQRLAKLGRVYRMRGLLMKAVRALMLLQFVNRLLRITPEKKLAKLQSVYAEKEIELQELKEEIEELQQDIDGGSAV